MLKVFVKLQMSVVIYDGFRGSNMSKDDQENKPNKLLLIY